MMEWYDDDQFWRVMAPKMFTQERWQQAVSEVDDIIGLLHLEKGVSILDLCCGPGRHTLEFLRRGFGVTSVDRTLSYLDELRIRAATAGLNVNIVQSDARMFVRPSSFDAVISLFTSFGYFGETENSRMLENIHASLKTGGRLVLQIMGKENLARIFRERDWHEENGVLYLEERILEESWNKVRNRWIMVDGNNRSEFAFTIFIYSARELADLLRKAGFSDVTAYGNLKGIPYDQNAECLVMTAVK